MGQEEAPISSPAWARVGEGDAVPRPALGSQDSPVQEGTTGCGSPMDLTATSGKDA